MTASRFWLLGISWLVAFCVPCPILRSLFVRFPCSMLASLSKPDPSFLAEVVNRVSVVSRQVQQVAPPLQEFCHGRHGHPQGRWHNTTMWPLARVVQVHPGKDKLVRVATVQTAKDTYKRPVSKNNDFNQNFDLVEALVWTRGPNFFVTSKLSFWRPTNHFATYSSWVHHESHTCIATQFDYSMQTQDRTNANTQVTKKQ